MQTEKIDLSEALPLIKSVLATGGVFRLYPHGVSMLPTIREGRDTVSLSSPEGIKRGDIVLYTRQADGAPILHRVVRATENGFDIRGDNQIMPEKDVRSQNVIAVVSEYTNGKRTVKRGSFTFGIQNIAADIERPFKRLYRHFFGFSKK